MAGGYADVLSNRMLLDVDGSRIHTFHGTDMATLTGAELVTLNNEESDDLGATTSATVDTYHVVFPEKRDVQGLYLGFAQADPDDWLDVTVESSGTTTDGIDGIWTEAYALNRVQEGTVRGWWGHTATGDYRRYIRATAGAMASKALRIACTPQSGSTVWSLKSVHVFGTASSEFAGDRLAFWHPTLDVRVPGGYFDWGHAPLGSSAERKFRLRNLSPVHRAESITLTTDALTDATPSVPRQHYLSLDGSSFANSVTLGKLEIGALSRTLTLRRVTPSTAVPGPWALRLRAVADQWVEVVGA